MISGQLERAKRCGAEMTFVAALPQVGRLPRLNTFHRTKCDAVSTEPIASAASRFLVAD